MRQGFTPGDPRARSAGVKGGSASAQARELQRRRAWIAQGIDPDLASEIRRQAYLSGYAAGVKHGRRETHR